MKFFQRKIVLLLIVGLLGLALFSAFFHHHDGSEDGSSCAVCHFVKKVGTAFVLAGFAILLALRREPFDFLFKSTYRLLLSAEYPARAPPFLS